MRKTTLSIGLAVAIAAATAFAQPAGGGYGPGNGPCAAGTPGVNCPAGGPGAGAGPGPGAGYGRGGRMMGGGPGFGPGGGLMTDEERAEHRATMHSFTTVQECQAYWNEHRAEMAQRAQERGVQVGPGPRRGDPCERMAARGFLKRGS